MSSLTAEWLIKPTHAASFLHQLAHRFVLATRRSTRNAQTQQDRGVDAGAVALDDLHTPCLTHVDNVSTFHLSAVQHPAFYLMQR